MYNRLAARTRYKLLIVGIADDRRTLCGTIANGIWELYALQELLNLLVEGSAANDNLVEVAAKGIYHLLAYLLVYLLAYDRHVKEQTHTVVLYLREHLLAYNLLDNERYGNDDGWLNLCKGSSDDSRRRHACEVEDVATN